MSFDASLGGLFLSGFISSTLLPGGSEALFGWMLSQGEYPIFPMFIAVTVGNALGGIVTFLMGRALAKRYPVKALEKPEHIRAQHWLNRFGPFTLLLSWLPIVGDPLCFMAGWLRSHFILSALMITLGKGARYTVLIVLFS